MSFFLKVGFYASVLRLYFGGRSGFVSRPPGSAMPPSAVANLRQRPLRIHFAIGAQTPGARMSVTDMVPELIQSVKALNLPWEISHGTTFPTGHIDLLFGFKTKWQDVSSSGAKKKILLIPDQGDSFWKDLNKYDHLISTSCLKFAELLTVQNKNVSLIEDATPDRYFQKQDNDQKTGVLWHGHMVSLRGVHPLKDVLARFGQQYGATLKLVTNIGEHKVEKWGDKGNTILVEWIPWSEKALFDAARLSKIGIVPAIPSLRGSFLKPASRLQYNLAMGVPSVGDGRVPHVQEFVEMVPETPIASSKKEWAESMTKLWNSSAMRLSLVENSRKFLLREFSTVAVPNRWVNIIADLSKTPLD
jgi:hypothetical protein